MSSAVKRKRSALDKPASGQHVRKKARPSLSPSANPSQIKHAVLSRYFTELLSLRDYISRVLPVKSRLRRRKIAYVGSETASTSDIPAIEQKLGHLLDTTIVGLTEEANPIPDDDRWQHWATLTQKGTPKGDESRVTLSDGLAGSTHSQSEILDFVTWQLFSRCKSSTERPEHILCDGFRRNQDHANFQFPRPLHANPQNAALRQSPWPELMKLLGKSGDRIMVDLLLDRAIFTSLAGEQGNYRQLSGIPLSKAKALPLSDHLSEREVCETGPANITFVRNRMLYARAALNARGHVQFGLRHIHVLNRMPYTPLDNHAAKDDGLASRNQANTRRVMMYMFPRQFGLHNVFTSTVDRRETAERLKDYTLREQEISAKFGQKEVRVPKRLQGAVDNLVQKLQVSHARCSYSKLLQHHCPVVGTLDNRGSSQSSLHKGVKSTQKTIMRKTQSLKQGQPAAVPQSAPRYSLIVDLATPVAHVSAFCQTVISKILPSGFLGKDDELRHNRSLLLRKVDQFVRLRRFESMSLHEIMQGMKITDIEWLAPPQLRAHKTSQTDFRKRTELFYELLYYVFDSILIPLLRSNFYVTESNVDKYRLFFFRHDVWRHVAEPAMTALKVRMFEEVDLHDASKILDSRQLGFSQVRLLPKGATVRPIMNLRKKMVKRGCQNLLGPSINTLLRPVHTVLQLEKALHPDKLGCAMSSVGDIYQRLIAFKTRLGSSNSSSLYFAKVDVQAAFDTIPQSAIVHLFNSIPQQQTYQLAKHVQVANNGFQGSNTRKPRVKWLSTAMENGSLSALLRSIEKTQLPKTKNTIFIEDVFRKDYDTSSMLQLVASHVQQNLVKIGKKYYRQKEGIPQGSVLSSTLCNYFYADLEIQVLAFLDADDCLLLRLIDDFLLVTTDEAKAARFVATMHAGVPEYGISVSPAKTLVNFDLVVGGALVSRTTPGTAGFPYCGTLIDTSTLNISKDRRAGGARAPLDNRSSIFDSLTVEYTRIPGQTFERKVLNAFKIQSHLMYLDTSLNTTATVLANLHGAFLETAAKTWAYARCLPAAKRPGPALVIRSLQRLADVAFLLATSKTRRARYPGYVCDVRKVEIVWLAYSAFAEVLRRKQSNYLPVLEWLRRELKALNALKDIRQGRISGVVRTLD